MTEWTLSPAWWITMVELPVISALFWLIWRNRRDATHELSESRRMVEVSHSQLREALAAYKLEVAKSYASIAYIKDVEKRLTTHLERIEHKLDAVQSGRGGKP